MCRNGIDMLHRIHIRDYQSTNQSDIYSIPKIARRSHTPYPVPAGVPFQRSAQPDRALRSALEREADVPDHDEPDVGRRQDSSAFRCDHGAASTGGRPRRALRFATGSRRFSLRTGAADDISAR